MATALVALVIAPVAVSASHVFDDVPDDNTFHEDIAWLADAGVTLGCNPPANTNYCPDSAVTRGQMSAFMHRLADNQVVDAAELVGEAPAHYTNPIYGTTCRTGACPDAGALELLKVLELTVDAPEDGYLQVNSSYSVNSGGTNSFVQIWVALDTATECGDWFIGPVEELPGSFALIGVDTGLSWGNAGSSVVTPITAGSHTLQLCAIGVEAIDSWGGSLSTVFSGVGGFTPTTTAVTPADYSFLEEVFGS